MLLCTISFVLSEEDQTLFKEMREAIDNQGIATVSLMHQFEKRLEMKVSDMRKELRINMGADTVDLDAKEQKFLSQIAMLLSSSQLAANSALGAPSGTSSNSAGEKLACWGVHSEN